MDQNKEDNKEYIKNQKLQIDKMLDDFNYRPAFNLLVLTLSELNEIDTKNLYNIIMILSLINILALDRLLILLPDFNIKNNLSISNLYYLFFISY
jgi:hypothetical protein